MTVDMDHRLLRPVRLEHIVAFFRSKIAFNHPLLIDIRDRIVGTDRSRKIFKRPVGCTGQPRHRLLLFQMPVDQTDHITFRPIAIARSTWNATIQGSIAGTFITALSCLDVLQIIKSIFRMTTGMAVTSPLYMQEVFYLLHLLF